GDQRRGDRARVSRNRGTDTPVDSVAHALDDGRVAEPEARTARRGGDLDLADRKAGRADPLKIEIAGKVVAARAERCARRAEARLHFDERADRRRLALAYRDPHAVGRFVEAAAFQPLHFQDDAIGKLALLAHFAL